jgi:hypothetical protein
LTRASAAVQIAPAAAARDVGAAATIAFDATADSANGAGCAVGLGGSAGGTLAAAFVGVGAGLAGAKTNAIGAVSADDDRFQSTGGTICTMLPHLGQARISPITDSSLTLSRERQVVH